LGNACKLFDLDHRTDHAARFCLVRNFLMENAWPVTHSIAPPFIDAVELKDCRHGAIATPRHTRARTQ
jgi:hypothetical protein